MNTHVNRIKRLFPLVLFLSLVGRLCAQEDVSMDSLQAHKTEIQTKLNQAKKAVAAAQGELTAIQKRIDIMSGWLRGFSGSVGFNFAGSSRWVANPNPTSTSTGLSIHVTAFANRQQPKYFWNNKLIITKAWQKVNLAEENDSRFFDNATVDILNLSSLSGYKFNDKWAVSGLVEFNSSIENFLEPATLDLGIGITWNPISSLSVAIHPANYHTAWSAQNIQSRNALGAKFRADYQSNFSITERTIRWSSTLTSFLPYTNRKTTVDAIDEFGGSLGTTREAGLFVWTWLNTFSFQVWKNLGIGFNMGFRNADYEFPELQTYYDLGLTYNL